MASYLGNLPSNNFVSLKRQVITGNGGSTYFEADYPKYHSKDFSHLSEWDLESLIDKYEGVNDAR